MYHRASYISTVLDSLLITFHKGNSIRLSCVRSHFLTHSSSTTKAEYQHLPGRHAAHVTHLPCRHAAHVTHLPGRHAAHVSHLPGRHAAHVLHLPGRYAANVPHLPGRHAAHVPRLPGRHAAYVPSLPGRHAEIYHSACVPHTQKLKYAIGMQHANRRISELVSGMHVAAYE